MASIRIQHVRERNVTFTLWDASQPLVGPQDTCALCLQVHTFKTYHLRLDETGSALVSLEVWERLRRMGPFTGFELMGEVANPPPQFIGIGGPVGVTAPIVKLDQ